MRSRKAVNIFFVVLLVGLAAEVARNETFGEMPATRSVWSRLSCVWEHGRITRDNLPGKACLKERLFYGPRVSLAKSAP